MSYQYHKRMKFSRTWCECLRDLFLDAADAARRWWRDEVNDWFDRFPPAHGGAA